MVAALAAAGAARTRGSRACMSIPRISIAMTTYNGSAHVVEQLESFRDQSLPPDEVVICDDLSSDDTVAKLEAFARTAPFEVRIERNPTNLTTTRNFEKSVSLCRGEFIFLADQDDVWRRNKIATLVDVLERNPDTGAVFSNGRVVDEQLAPLGYTLWDSLWFSEPEQALVRDGRGSEVFVKHVVAAGTTLAFRSKYKDVYLPFPQLHDCHDAWLSFTICGVSRVRIVDECLIEYRLHGKNQFGLQRFNLREQIDKAREQLEIGIFRHNMTFFTAAKQAIEGGGDAGFEPDVRTLALATDKIAHARLRDGMSPRLLSRLAGIAAETLNGGYFRFSYGLKSIAQDLFLR
jgi:glycosyltransferase involved in cell wall biosynthesis